MVEFSIEALTLHLKVYCLTRFLFLFFCIKLLLLVCLLVVVFQHRDSNTRYSGHRLGGQKVREGEATGSVPPFHPNPWRPLLAQSPWIQYYQGSAENESLLNLAQDSGRRKEGNPQKLEL